MQISSAQDKDKCKLYLPGDGVSVGKMLQNVHTLQKTKEPWICAGFAVIEAAHQALSGTLSPTPDGGLHQVP